MEIEITVYKESGKYYTSRVVNIPEGIAPWNEEFEKFIKNNLPADIGEGYVVVKSIEDGKPHKYFYDMLLKYEDLK